MKKRKLLSRYLNSTTEISAYSGRIRTPFRCIRTPYRFKKILSSRFSDKMKGRPNDEEIGNVHSKRVL
jgi:hypothetical protein